MTNNNQRKSDWEEFETDDFEKSISYADALKYVKNLLPWIIICGFLGLVFSFIFYKKQEPQYTVKAKILIKDKSATPGDINNLDIFQSLGIMTGASSVFNELEIITAYSIMDKVVKDLGLNINVKKDQFFNSKKNKTYDVPFQVNVLKYNPNAFENTNSFVYSITNDDEEGLSIDIDENQTAFSLNKPIELPFGTIIISSIRKKNIEEGNWIISVENPISTVSQLIESIKPSMPNKNTSIINLELNTPNPQRDHLVLNKLIDTYILEGVKDNNSINDSTLVFINDRLKQVTLELNEVEQDVQNFKQTNNLADISTQAKILLEANKENSQKLLEAEIQLNVISSLEKHIKSSSTFSIIPSSLLTQDMTLATLINQYNGLLVQKDRIAKNSTIENPILSNLNSQINSVRMEIIEAISSTRRSYASVVSQLRNESNKNLSTIRKVPKQERAFLDISRQQLIKQELYLFLLKKREETAIGKSSTLSNTRVIDYARTINEPISPKRNLILLAGLIIGAMIPFAFSFVRKKISSKLETKNDVKEWTSMTIIGEIGHQTETELFEVKAKPNSALAEQFRILRTNLLFYKKSEEATVFMITSSVPGEGKTFVSLNLAATLAANKEYKVLVIGMDLRKPRLANELKLKNSDGLTNYIANQASLEDIIYPINGFNNLYVMPSGTVPPDPSELLMANKTEQMFVELKKNYDFIFIDCPPSIVTDYQIIGKFSDLSLYVCRIGYTEKRQIEIAEELYRTNKLPKMNLVVNDFNPEKYDSYNGGYYSQYGYYESDKKLTFREDFFAKLKSIFNI